MLRICAIHIYGVQHAVLYSDFFSLIFHTALKTAG